MLQTYANLLFQLSYCKLFFSGKRVLKCIILEVAQIMTYEFADFVKNWYAIYSFIKVLGLGCLTDRIKSLIIIKQRHCYTTFCKLRAHAKDHIYFTSKRQIIRPLKRGLILNESLQEVGTLWKLGIVLCTRWGKKLF